jgi:hypothetical protein
VIVRVLGTFAFAREASARLRPGPAGTSVLVFERPVASSFMAPAIRTSAYLVAALPTAEPKEVFY